jgi:deoxyhypusine synthase
MNEIRFNGSDYKRYHGVTHSASTDGLTQVRGYDFEAPFDFERFIESYRTTGLQATQLGRAIEVARKMFASDAKVLLTGTSNMGSSGIREIIRYLVRQRRVHTLCMSAGALEEDLVKALRPFVLGNFDAKGGALLDDGLGRIGNIFAPYEHYLVLEERLQPFFHRIYHDARDRGRPYTVSELLRELGREIDHEDSFLYWAFRNDVPVYCPAVTDGALGDLLVFAKIHYPDFYLDIIGDSHRIFEYVRAQPLTAGIFLGGGSAKHFVLNAGIFRDGLDYSVYISTAVEYDGSDSGGNPEEAISWGKLQPKGEHVKVACEASIAFPLLIAGALAR